MGPASRGRVRVLAVIPPRNWETSPKKLAMRRMQQMHMTGSSSDSGHSSPGFGGTLRSTLCAYSAWSSAARARPD